MANLPNVKYLAHLPHQTQKWSFMRCAKSQKLYNMVTVLLQMCNSMDRCCKNFIILSSLFSLLSLHFFFSLLSHSLVPSLFSLYRFLLSSTNPGCSPAAMIGIAPTMITRSATLDLTHAPATLDLADLTHAQSHRSHPKATVDLTLFALLSVHLSLCLSLVVGFFFWLQFGLI